MGQALVLCKILIKQTGENYQTENMCVGVGGVGGVFTDIEL